MNAYSIDEQNFLMSIKPGARSSVPKSVNNIGIHTIYMLKQNIDHPLKVKVRFEPHRNEDSDKDMLKTDCCMCPTSDILVIASTATISQWRVVRADADSSFLQTGSADRKVYVIPR